MRCELITPASSMHRLFSEVRSLRAASEAGALEIFSGHVAFFAAGNASPLHVLFEDGREDSFLLLRPTYRVAQNDAGETVVTITAQQAFFKESGVHLSLKGYVERLHDALSVQALSSHEKIFLENEVVATEKFVRDEK